MPISLNPFSELYHFEFALKAVRAGSTSGKGTFQEWLNRAQDTRRVLFELLDDDSKKFADAKGIYANNIVDQMYTELTQRKQFLSGTAKKLILDDFDKLIETRREALHKASGAPTDEQLRLLQTLALRTKLSAADVSQAAAHCADSLSALQVLADLARANGISFPHIVTAGEFEDTVSQAREGVENLVESVATPLDDLRYLDRLAWTTQTPGRMAPLFASLDSPTYLHPDLTEITDADVIDQKGLTEEVESYVNQKDTV